MTRQASDNLDELIEIDCEKVAEALDRFVDESRGISDVLTSSGSSVFRFEAALRFWMTKLGKPVGKAETVLASRSTIHNWRNGQISGSVKRRRVVLNAVLALTGKDISRREILASTPLHFSDIVELGPVSAQRINAANAVGVGMGKRTLDCVRGPFAALVE